MTRSNDRRVEMCRGRRGKRGVALVETVMTMPIIVMFFVLDVWVMASMDQRIYIQRAAREQAMFYASHSCNVKDNSSESATGGSSAGGIQTNLPGLPAVSNKVAGADFTNADLVGGSHSRVSAATASVEKQDGIVNAMPYFWSKAIDSWVLCNEPLYGGDGHFSSILGFFDFFITVAEGISGVKPSW